MTFGMLSSAIRMGEVMIPKIANTILRMPAVYSFWRHAKEPSINAKGLKSGDKIKIPMNPNMIPSVP